MIICFKKMFLFEGFKFYFLKLYFVVDFYRLNKLKILFIGF